MAGFSKTRAFARLCACAAVWFFGSLAAKAADPSLCLSAPAGCNEPGTTVNTEVLLGASDSIVVGAQFELQFEPGSLTAFEVLPGASCDPTSPFSLEIYEEFDNTAGRLFYAVGVDFTKSEGTSDAATVACLRFLPRGVSMSSIEVLVGEGPRTTCLSNEDGHLVTVNNAVACPTPIPGALASVQAMVEDMCQCAVDADCETFTDECREGVCDQSVMLCGVMPRNEGGACNDLNDCTSNDHCSAGRCAGSGCTNPSLCLGDSCTPPESWAIVPVLLGEGEPLIVGGQFSLRWDPAGLEFIDASPGVACDLDSPFTLEIHRTGNPSAGELFYSVGVDFEAEGTHGPAAMACLYFRVLDRSLADICLYDDINPRLTKLVDEHGQLVSIYNDGVCGSDLSYPFIHCDGVDRCKIPAASEWGVAAMGLLLLILAKLRFGATGRNPHPAS